MRGCEEPAETPWRRWFRGSSGGRLGVSTVLLLVLASPLAATQVKIFRAQSQSAFLAGTLSGVSVDSLGRIELAPRAERLAAVAEPFLFSAAVRA
ncbi:MAG TPA: hypothetical protein VFE33_11600, partial [Thermoanaerobaculia bacterium]|nr:hypothetical protein [Thermoanaerobaculia bacterium]